MFASAIRPLVRPASTILRASPKFTRPVATRLTAVRFASTRYTPDHEWVRVDDDKVIGTVGITNYAKQALGDIVYCEMVQPGTEVEAGAPFAAVESVKAASDIYAPLDGTIEEINSVLEDSANLINKDPEGEGWICKIRLSKPAEFDTLLDAEAYKALCEGEEEDGGS